MRWVKLEPIIRFIIFKILFKELGFFPSCSIWPFYLQTFLLDLEVNILFKPPLYFLL